MSQENKSIDTLVKDIEFVLLNGAIVEDEEIEAFGQLVAKTMYERINDTARAFTLRLSNIGHPCVRKLWLDKHRPEGKEPLRASAKLKFLYGDLIELLLLFLAKLSGHDVRDQQKERNLHGIKGHSDATIDGRITDTKSASSPSFKKFKDGLTREKDSFGYLGQLGSYHGAAQDDPAVTDKQSASFLVADKQHGHIVLDTHTFDHGNMDWEGSIEDRVRVVGDPDHMPDRAFSDIEDGYKNKEKVFVPNGSKKLGVNCSYCDQKFNCWPNIRILVGSKGPVYYTELKHKFKMKEISRKEHDTGEIEETIAGGTEEEG